MRTIAIINQKGGCGKTTTAINLSAAAASRGRRVLLIDLDPQSHCALGLSVPTASIDRQIGDAMLADLSRPFELGDLRWQVGTSFDLIPSSIRLAALESMNGGLARLPDRDRRLEQLLRWHSQDYDICVIDCPPHIGLLTYNALRAATDVLIPVETSFFALQGADNQMKTIASVSRRIGRSINAMLLPTMYDEQQQLPREILSELRKRFGTRVAPLEIRYCTALRESASFGQPVHEYAPKSTATEDYDELLTWIEKQTVKPVTFMTPVEHSSTTDGTTGGARGYGTAGDIGHSESGMPLVETTGAGSRFSNGLSHGESGYSVSGTGTTGFGSGLGSSGSSGVLPQPGNRAAELAQRARTLLQRQHELQARLESDRRLNEAYAPVVGDLTDDSPLDRRPPTGMQHTALHNDEQIQDHVDDAHSQLPVEPKTSTCSANSDTKHIAPIAAALQIGSADEPVPGVRLVNGRVRFVYRSDMCVEHVEVAGEFNQWIPTKGRMVFNEDFGVFEAWFDIEPGRYRYRLVVDGRWIVDPNGVVTETNEDGEEYSVFEMADSRVPNQVGSVIRYNTAESNRLGVTPDDSNPNVSNDVKAMPTNEGI